MKRISVGTAFLLFVILFSTMVYGDSGDFVDLDAVKKAIVEKGLNWTAGPNPILQKSPDELLSLLTDFVPQVEPGDAFFQMDSSAGLPSSMDWRNYGGNYVTPVRDQSSCGSCWAFASVATVEARDAVTNHITDPTTNLSEQQVLSCSGAGTCDGGYLSQALNYIRDYGTPDEDCFSYSATDESCDNQCADWESRAMQIESWAWVTTTNYGDTNLIKTALMNGPVPAWFRVYTDFYAYNSGVYEYAWGSYLGNHFVLIVGWNDAEQAWIVKNSWGDDWGGLGGYFKIKWGAVEFGSWTADVIAYETCSDGCNIDGICYLDGMENPSDSCQVCDVEQSNTGWTYLGDWQPCDDGLSCNGYDYCLSGSCSDHQYPDGNGGCGDGTWCNGEETCNEQTGQCESGDDPCPDDGAWCNGDEFCDEQDQQCLHTGDKCSDDGLFCNGSEYCDEAGDQCQSTGSPCADDAAFCNGIEYCDEGSDQCFSTGNPCSDDSQWCNGDEYCDESWDQCLHTSSPQQRCPDDGQWCNGTEFCNENEDQCGHSSTPDQLCPDDGLWCNGVESCDDANDRCAHSMTPETRCPDDTLWCNGNEYCDDNLDECRHSTSANQLCPDDGAFCNGSESCDEANDQCASSGNPCPSDGNFCNGSEYCDEQADSCNSTGDPCPDDGLFCTGTESCDETNDVCTSESIPDCDDTIACTIDYCDPQTDACANLDETCSSVVFPECPAETPTESFEVAVMLSSLRGEDQFGFSLSFDSELLVFSGYTTEGTALAGGVLECEVPSGITSGGIIDCYGSCQTIMPPSSAAVLAIFQFDLISDTPQTDDDDFSLTPQKSTGIPAPDRAWFVVSDLTDDLQFFQADKCSILFEEVDDPADDDDMDSVGIPSDNQDDDDIDSDDDDTDDGKDQADDDDIGDDDDDDDDDDEDTTGQFDDEIDWDNDKVDNPCCG